MKVPVFVLGLCTHAVLEAAASGRPLEVGIYVSNAICGAVVEILVRALGFDDERRGGALHQAAVALRVADVDEQFGISLHIDVAAAEVGELHRALRPIRLHDAEREARANDEVLDVSSPHSRADFQESLFPRFPLPAMRRIGIHAESFITVTDLDEVQEIIRR